MCGRIVALFSKVSWAENRSAGPQFVFQHFLSAFVDALRDLKKRLWGSVFLFGLKHYHGLLRLGRRMAAVGVHVGELRDVFHPASFVRVHSAVHSAETHIEGFLDRHLRDYVDSVDPAYRILLQRSV